VLNVTWLSVAGGREVSERRFVLSLVMRRRRRAAWSTRFGFSTRLPSTPPVSTPPSERSVKENRVTAWFGAAVGEISVRAIARSRALSLRSDRFLLRRCGEQSRALAAESIGGESILRHRAAGGSALEVGTCSAAAALARTHFHARQQSTHSTHAATAHRGATSTLRCFLPPPVQPPSPPPRSLATGPGSAPTRPPPSAACRCPARRAGAWPWPRPRPPTTVPPRPPRPRTTCWRRAASPPSPRAGCP